MKLCKSIYSLFYEGTTQENEERKRKREKHKERLFLLRHHHINKPKYTGKTGGKISFLFHLTICSVFLIRQLPSKPPFLISKMI